MNRITQFIKPRLQSSHDVIDNDESQHVLTVGNESIDGNVSLKASGQEPVDSSVAQTGSRTTRRSGRIAVNTGGKALQTAAISQQSKQQQQLPSPTTSPMLSLFSAGSDQQHQHQQHCDSIANISGDAGISATDKSDGSLVPVKQQSVQDATMSIMNGPVSLLQVSTAIAAAGGRAKSKAVRPPPSPAPTLPSTRATSPSSMTASLAIPPVPLSLSVDNNRMQIGNETAAAEEKQIKVHEEMTSMPDISETQSHRTTVTQRRRKSLVPVKAVSQTAELATPGIIFKVSSTAVDVLKKPADYPEYSRLMTLNGRVVAASQPAAAAAATGTLLSARRLRRKFFGGGPSGGERYQMDVDPIEGFPTSELFYHSFAHDGGVAGGPLTAAVTAGGLRQPPVQSALLNGWRNNYPALIKQQQQQRRRMDSFGRFTDPATIEDLEYFDEDSTMASGEAAAVLAGGPAALMPGGFYYDYDFEGAATKPKKKRKPSSASSTGGVGGGQKRPRSRQRSASEKYCYSCKTTQTPIWREVKDTWGDGWEDVMLCNACGLRKFTMFQSIIHL
jgi:hypothetical protein